MARAYTQKMSIHPLATEFGSWLKRVREGRGLNLKDAAELCNMNTGSFRELEKSRGRSSQPMYTFEALADGFGLDLGFVLHQAGFPIGRESVNMARLDKMEAVAAQFDANEHEIRKAIAFAAEKPTDPVAANLLRSALSKLDLITEELREGRNGNSS